MVCLSSVEVLASLGTSSIRRGSNRACTDTHGMTLVMFSLRCSSRQTRKLIAYINIFNINIKS